MDSPEPKTTKTVSREDVSKESMANSRQVIGINFCGSTPLMWRADELKSARELGIIGTMVGSLARQPRQNTRMGRPLELLPEEGRLLADMGRAAVIPDSTNEDPEVNPEQVEQYHAGLENSFQEQGALALEDRKTTLRRVMTEKHNGEGAPSLTYRGFWKAGGLGRCGSRPSRSSGPRLLIPSHGHGGTTVHSPSRTVSLSRGAPFPGRRLAHTTGREVRDPVPSVQGPETPGLLPHLGREVWGRLPGVPR
ncbi:tRNA-splicing endonuclease subunit Sen34 isoform X2 [Coregonus clupeaformis]|uniref:tRNA-splicing endonuclease subunit Sen34 isoform X2 n=1 Tax=Coregonus clupeaformis TaxID=59861 RepID=UPI001BDFDF69|nr:tRNA-splicing endonuclease subunit Sen34 isoform X2 [Coregonus clupeaformis]